MLNSRRQKIRQAIAVITVFLFPVTFYYMSPYLVIVGAAQGVLAGDVLFFVGLFAASLFFGRAFCGWICPAGAAQDFCSRVNDKSYNGKKRNLIKYFIWAPWVAMAILLFVQAGGVKSVNPLYQTWNGISVSDAASAVMFAVVTGAIVGLALVAGKRAECHSVCWMAPFMIAGTKIKNAVGIPSLHLTADKSQCVPMQAMQQPLSHEPQRHGNGSETGNEQH
jgi:polyferredoxin